MQRRERARVDGRTGTGGEEERDRMRELIGRLAWGGVQPITNPFLRWL